jgi:hypothetical protein
MKKTIICLTLVAGFALNAYPQQTPAYKNAKLPVEQAAMNGDAKKATVQAQTGRDVSTYNVVWDTPSQNSGESMPCGGGDIGLNVWVENGDILFYIARSGTFDENNEMLKLGRVRLTLQPGIVGNDFRQTLNLERGCVTITGNGTEALLWVDVFRPVVHVEITGRKESSLKVSYENWRFEDYPLQAQQYMSTSYFRAGKMWDIYPTILTRKDIIETSPEQILFYHRNREDVEDVFDRNVRLQYMDSVKDQMYNPLRTLTSGGYIKGTNLAFTGTSEGKYADTRFKAWNMESAKNNRNHSIEIGLVVEQTQTIDDWKTLTADLQSDAHKNRKTAKAKTFDWWEQYWNRSYIYINGDADEEKRQVARNYQLFRYMLGCNAFGKWPTKFNGGLFTFDPCYVDKNNHCTPDFRQWYGGVMTAQNQRLVYWGLLRSGDVEMMKPQFDFYLRSLKNAELRTKLFWNHDGACFTEQIENFGLPSIFEYLVGRPAGNPYELRSREYNATLEYLWETVLEFCMMILETEHYANKDITEYIPLVESCLTFFDEHYRQLAAGRSALPWDSRLEVYAGGEPPGGYYVFYPTSAAETYKMAYNSTTVVSALKVILSRMGKLPEKYLTAEKRAKWTEMLKRIPPVPVRELNGHKMLAPAEMWQYVRNFESPQLYPVFPWGLYGVGKPDLDIAKNTYFYDPSAQKYREQGHLCWAQYPIWAARLGMTDEASEQIKRKMKNANQRFPAFLGSTFDWIPDSDWMGVGMIALQEMLMQTDDEKIYLLAAFPKDWDVQFKLHAPYNTTVEASVKDGKVTALKVTPEERRKDVVIAKEYERNTNEN